MTDWIARMTDWIARMTSVLAFSDRREENPLDSHPNFCRDGNDRIRRGNDRTRDGNDRTRREDDGLDREDDRLFDVYDFVLDYPRGCFDLGCISLFLTHERFAQRRDTRDLIFSGFRFKLTCQLKSFFSV